MTWKRISPASPPGNKRPLRAVAFIAAAAALVAGLTVAAVGGASATAHAASPSCSAATTVQTKDGPVCGLTADNITSYLDIPYAAPPVGDLRWKPPQPHAPWTTVLQATTAAPECPSPGFPPGSPPAAGTSVPTVHTVELIDWASGGPCPSALQERRGQAAELPSVAAG